MTTADTFPRCAGLTLSPHALGAGQALGRPAHRLLSFLIRSGLSYWHAPSLHAQCERKRARSLLAKDPAHIDVALLAHAGLCTPDQSARDAAEALCADPKHPFRPALEQFAQRSFWAQDWGLYAALLAAHDGAPPHTWADPVRRGDGAGVLDARGDLKDKILIEVALQFFFDMQWQILRVMGHDTGLRMVTDLPVVLSPDAFEVWLTPDAFVVDEDNARPHFRRMVNDGFRLYRQALEAMLADADLVRVGPSASLAPGAVSLVDAWRTLRHDLPLIPYDHTPPVGGADAFRKTVRLPRPAVLSGAFGSDASHRSLPHHVGRNVVVFTSRPGGPSFEAALDEGAAAHAHAYFGTKSGLGPAAVKAALKTAAHTVLIGADDLSTMGALPSNDDDGDDLAERIGALVRLSDRDELKRLRDGSLRRKGPHSPRL